MTLEAKLKDLLEKIEGGTNFPNERSISQGIVLPILRELNWDTDNTSLVWPEYTVGGGLADFALCGESDNPKVFIEVKKLGGVEKAERKAEDQVMRYAHSKGVRIVVLTDGRTWSLYLPEKGGMGYDGKRVFKLNISERHPQESSEVLQRYLEESRVVSDKALETARVIFFLRKHRNSNPGMWEEPFKRAVGLVRALHHLVPVALAEELGPKFAQGDIDPDIVDYFHSLLREEISQSSSGPVSPSPPPPSPPGPGGSSRSGKLVILGKSFHYRDAKDAMVIVFKELERREPGFCQRFYNDPRNHGQTRRTIAQNSRELYDLEHLAKNHERIDDNWVIATNNSNSQKKKIITIAAEVAGLKFGRDIIINFDN